MEAGDSGVAGDLLPGDWSVAYVDFCPLSDWLEVGPDRYKIGFMPCNDPDYGRTNLVLFRKDGSVVGWFPAALPTPAARVCFTPDAVLTWSGTGFSFGSQGVVSCSPAD